MNREASRISLLLLCLPVAAWSAPGTARYVDPQAPSFRWPAVDFDSDGVFDRLDRCPSTLTGCTVNHWGCPADTDADSVCDGRDQCGETPSGTKVDANGCHAGAHSARDAKAQAELPKQVTRPGKPTALPAPPVTEAERQLVERGRIRLENVYFETGSAVLLSESEAALNEAGEALGKFSDIEIEVEGHTDTRGSTRHNQSLSQARAETVRDYLIRRFKLRPDHLKARGYGERRPETRERNQEEMLRNRRVELRVLNPSVLPRNVKIGGAR